MAGKACMFAVGVVLAAAVVGCADEPAGFDLPTHTFLNFQEEVYPTLLRDCGFQACHGAKERFFRVWGPGRARMNPMPVPGMDMPDMLNAFDRPTANEVATSFELARSMIDADKPERSLLLRKPLSVSAGGAGHLGTDQFGRDVYRSTDDEGYLSLARWVFSASANP